MVKSSFTLLETLLSLSLITFIVIGFLNSSYYDNTNHENFMILNSLENKFDTNNFSSFNKSSKTLKITINESDVRFINVKQYSFKNENIKLIKYEK